MSEEVEWPQVGQRARWHGERAIMTARGVIMAKPDADGTIQAIELSGTGRNMVTALLLDDGRVIDPRVCTERLSPLIPEAPEDIQEEISSLDADKPKPELGPRDPVTGFLLPESPDEASERSYGSHLLLGASQVTLLDAKCQRCYGRGWYPEVMNPEEPNPYNHDEGERYCDCAAGDKLRLRDTPNAAPNTEAQADGQ